MVDSLQTRLGLATVIVVTLFLFSSALVLDGAFKASERRAMQDRMLGQLYVLLSVTRIDATGNPILPKIMDLPQPELAISDSGLYAFVALDGNRLWRSPSSLYRRLPDPMPVPAGERLWQDIVLDDGKKYLFLGYSYPKTTHSGIHLLSFYLLADLSPFYHEIDIFRKKLWLGVLLVSLLLISTQILVLRWSLKPLRHVASELAEVEAGTCHRIEGNYPSEIRQLTYNINVLLTQERARQDRYRNALADLAHSLKTSLAVLGGAVHEPESLIENVIEQSERMTLIIERQLQRAAMMGNMTAIASISVYPLVERLLSSLNKVYQEKCVISNNHVDKALQFRGDESDLFEILGNLIDNAYKWCRQCIRVEGKRQDEGIILVIHDDGPGICPTSLDSLVQRGVRADETTPGHGIGLAVVNDIAEAYQGRLQFGVSSLGGAAVTIIFPI